MIAARIREVFDLAARRSCVQQAFWLCRVDQLYLYIVAPFSLAIFPAMSARTATESKHAVITTKRRECVNSSIVWKCGFIQSFGIQTQQSRKDNDGVLGPPFQSPGTVFTSAHLFVVVCLQKYRAMR